MKFTYNEKEMLFERPKRFTVSKVAMYGYIVICTIFLTSSFFTGGNKETITYEQAVMVINREDSFSKEKLVNMLVEMKIKHPHIVMAQAVIESGHFNSPIFIENNNMFGMKTAYARANVQLGVNRNHATYRSWRDCVIDYALYQSRYTAKLNEGEYLRYLQQNYAEAPNYFESIKAESDRCKKYFK